MARYQRVSDRVAKYILSDGQEHPFPVMDIWGYRVLAKEIELLTFRQVKLNVVVRRLNERPGRRWVLA